MLTPRSPRRSALAAVAAAALSALLLSACGDATARAGSAAVVGGEPISTDDLQGLVDRGLADPQAAQQFGADRETYQRQVLARLINRQILEVAAERTGVTVTQGEVDEQIAEFAEQAGGREALEGQAAQSGISPTDLPPFVRDIVMEGALGDALTKDVEVTDEELAELYQQNIAEYDQVRSRHILVEDETQARQILAQVKADETQFEPLAAEFSLDTSNKDQGGDLGLVGRGAFVPEFEELLFNADPGTYDVVQTQFGWHVVQVIERVTTSAREAEPELRRAALEDERTARTQDLLRSTAEDLDITVNPRFGVWNSVNGTVDPEPVPNGVSSPAPLDGGGPEAPTGGIAPGGDQPAPGEQPPGQQAPDQPAPSPAG